MTKFFQCFQLPSGSKYVGNKGGTFLGEIGQTDDLSFNTKAVKGLKNSYPDEKSLRADARAGNIWLAQSSGSSFPQKSATPAA
jgi:hypothetical protein